MFGSLQISSIQFRSVMLLLAIFLMVADTSWIISFHLFSTQNTTPLISFMKAKWAAPSYQKCSCCDLWVELTTSLSGFWQRGRHLDHPSYHQGLSAGAGPSVCSFLLPRGANGNHRWCTCLQRSVPGGGKGSMISVGTQCLPLSSSYVMMEPCELSFLTTAVQCTGDDMALSGVWVLVKLGHRAPPDCHLPICWNSTWPM